MVTHRKLHSYTLKMAKEASLDGLPQELLIKIVYQVLFGHPDEAIADTNWNNVPWRFNPNPGYVVEIPFHATLSRTLDADS